MRHELNVDRTRHLAVQSMAELSSHVLGQMDVRRHSINDMRLATETSLDFSAVAETIGAAVPRAGGANARTSES
ncbi:MAG: hypothetical protein V7646_6451 [Pseudonocardia sp.]